MIHSRSIIAGLIAVFLWAAIPALVKSGTTPENLTFLLVLRFVCASLIFLPFVLKIIKKSSEVSIYKWLTLGLILGVNYYFQGLAMHMVPASWYVVIFSLNPIIAIFLLRIPLDKNKILGFSAAAIGTLTFIFNDVDTNVPVLALVYITLGMMAWVLYTQQIRNFQKVYSDLETSALTQFISLLACLVLWMGEGLPIQSLKSEQGLSILVLGLTTPLAYFCFSYCMRYTPAFGLISQYLEPVFGIVIGILFFQEKIGFVQMVGAAAIVWGAARAEKRG